MTSIAKPGHEAAGVDYVWMKFSGLSRPARIPYEEALRGEMVKERWLKDGAIVVRLAETDGKMSEVMCSREQVMDLLKENLRKNHTPDGTVYIEPTHVYGDLVDVSFQPKGTDLTESRSLFAFLAKYNTTEIQADTKKAV